MNSGAGALGADTLQGTIAWRPRRSILIATLVIVGVHGALLCATLDDWRVTLDSGYHVSLVRAYAEHGLVPWDHINFGPAGRPNLRAPLMYLAVGALDSAIGGTATTTCSPTRFFSMVQWTAPVATAACFGLLLGGEWAMLIAAALLSGAGFASGAFAAGIPSAVGDLLLPRAASRPRNLRSFRGHLRSRRRCDDRAARDSDCERTATPMA